MSTSAEAAGPSSSKRAMGDADGSRDQDVNGDATLSTKKQRLDVGDDVHELTPDVKPTEPMGASAAEGSSSWSHLGPMPPKPEDDDCDSEGLEALEAEADADDPPDDEIELLVAQAAVTYPSDKVDEMIAELKEEGMVHFWRKYVADITPEGIKKLLVALGVLLPRQLRESDSMPQGLLLSILRTTLSRILRQRDKLPKYNTPHDAVELLRNAKRIVVLSGAGISVSCGIPDFRSKDGIYATLMREGKYALADPQDMFDKEYFLQDPACFYSFAHSIFPSNFTPSPTHRFIKLLEDKGKLLRNYSQNIDTLEQAAGITRVLNAHGSFATASCTTCGLQVPGASIKDAIFKREVPLCSVCHPEKKKGKGKKGGGKPKKGWTDGEDDESEEEDQWGFGVIKPDITFFGEKLSDAFDAALLSDRSHVDLLIIIGTSLKVAPVSELPAHLPHSTPVLLINRTPVLHVGSDVQMLGDADRVVEWLCAKLGWSLPAPEPDRGVVGEGAKAEELKTAVMNEADKKPAVPDPTRVAESHFWLFPGAEGGAYVERLLNPQSSDEDDDDEDESDDGGEGQAAVVGAEGDGDDGKQVVVEQSNVE